MAHYAIFYPKLIEQMFSYSQANDKPENKNRNGNTQGESSWTSSHHDESFKDKPRWLKLMQSFQKKQTDTKNHTNSPDIEEKEI